MSGKMTSKAAIPCKSPILFSSINFLTETCITSHDRVAKRLFKSDKCIHIVEVIQHLREKLIKMTYFSGAVSAADLRKALQIDFEKSQEASKEFEEVCRKSPLTSGQVVEDSEFFVIVQSILQELKDQDELIDKYETRLMANREQLKKLAKDKALIETTIQKLKSDTAIPNATVPRELCQLTLKVNEIMFGDLENVRDISPEVRKALYNHELERHKSKGSKGQTIPAGSQDVDLSHPSQQLRSQIAGSELDRIKSRLLTADQELKRLRTLSDQQKGLLDSIQSHKDDKLTHAQDEIELLRRRFGSRTRRRRKFRCQRWKKSLT